jgi:Mg-chelatase subunit ChlD
MRKRREINAFSISFLDLLSGALGAVIILYVAIPKGVPQIDVPRTDLVKEAMAKELSESKVKMSKAEAQIKTLEEELAKLKIAPVPVAQIEKKESDGNGSSEYDVGFQFKGNKIVFLIDTSLSMIDEDRMGQVKAGLKMLLTSMPSGHQIELIQFPYGERAPFRSLWGTTKTSGKFNKQDAFDFIFRLRPSGGTPTRDALLFALQNYENITDIVLLTDGLPTFHNSNKRDDIFDILQIVRESNKTKVQINTIGVGTDFLTDKTSPQYQFLSLMAQETGGFFVGF